MTKIKQMPNELPEDALMRVQTRVANSQMYDWLNFDVKVRDGALEYRLGFDEAHIGNPIIRAIHGGVVSAFLEACAGAEAWARLPQGTKIHVVSTHTSFLRSTKATDMICSVKAQRLGNRFGFLVGTAWQEDVERPVAFAEIGIRISRTQN